MITLTKTGTICQNRKIKLDDLIPMIERGDQRTEAILFIGSLFDEIDGDFVDNLGTDRNLRLASNEAFGYVCLLTVGGNNEGIQPDVGIKKGNRCGRARVAHKSGRAATA